jgi:COP9 signalosome complex subunit 3
MVALDLLRYFYYAGMVFVGLRRFEEACDCFRTVLATPAHALSAVVLESYKKLLLVMALLPSSSALPVPSAESGTSTVTAAASVTAAATATAASQIKALLPKKTPLVVSRSCGQMSLMYQDLLVAARAGNAEGVRALIEKHAEALMADKNLGLARQVRMPFSSFNPSLPFPFLPPFLHLFLVFLYCF